MVYFLTKLLAKVSFFGAYRKIYIINENNIPWDRAALITCNHPNGFVEPLVMASNLPKPIHYIARGDVFENKIVGWFLRAINLIPIFRFKDGFASLRKNNAFISESLTTLSNNQQLLIFAEGSTEQVRHIRPIQKGTIRLAFDALKQYPNCRPVIVPSVIHFTDFNFYRSEVYVNYGTPIDVKEYEELYDTKKAKAIKQLLARVTQAMEDMLISIPAHIDLKSSEEVLKLVRAHCYENNVFPILNKVTSLKNKDVEFNAAKRLSNLKEADRNELFKKVQDLSQSLNQKGITYLELAGKNKAGIGSLIFLLLGFVPFLIGKILHFIPTAMAMSFTNRKVKKIEFKAVIKLCSFLMYYPPYLILIIVVIAFFNWKLSFLVFLFPLLGWFSYLYKEMLDSLLKFRHFNKISGLEKESLLRRYSEIIDELKFG